MNDTPGFFERQYTAKRQSMETRIAELERTVAELNDQLRAKQIDVASAALSDAYECIGRMKAERDEARRQISGVSALLRELAQAIRRHENDTEQASGAEAEQAAIDARLWEVCR